MFYFTWLFIRKVELKSGKRSVDIELKKVEAFVKPLFIYLIYMHTNGLASMNGT